MQAAPESTANPAKNLTGVAYGLDAQQRRPTWSPDGKFIAYWRHLLSGTFPFDGGEVYQMRSDGTQVRNLTDNDDLDPVVGDIMPDWGPAPATYRTTTATTGAGLRAATPTPTPGPSPTGCGAVLYQSRWYCQATISKVKATAYGVGKRVVLTGASVTARTSTSVTLAMLEYPVCPPDTWCGSSITVERMTMPWSGSNRPAARTVVDLYAITTSGSLTPVGYIASSACYIDYC